MRECFTYVGTARNAVTGKMETVTVTCRETIAELKAIITALTGKSSTDSEQSSPGLVLEAREICGEFFLYELQHYDYSGYTRVTYETGICNLNPGHPPENLHRTAKGIPASRIRTEAILHPVPNPPSPEVEDLNRDIGLAQ